MVGQWQGHLLNSTIVVNLGQLLANDEWERVRSATSDFMDGVDDIFLAQQDGGKQISQGRIVDLPKA